MKPQHVLLALLVAVIWGFNFVVIQVGLGQFPPLLLAALRFVVAALPAVMLARPRVGWGRMAAIAGVLFVGQFAFLFTGMAAGMPAGLASIVLQVQAFFTILIAAAVLRERPGPRRVAGSVIAFVGLAVIAATVGGSVTVAGLALTLAAALCWAIGNVLLRDAGPVDMLAMVVWLSLVPPLPLAALAVALEGAGPVAHALGHIGWLGLGAVLYMGVPTTIAGFAIWGQLLKLYPATTVAPFSLLVPVFGAASAALVLGERFGPARLAGMALILVGLAVLALPAPLLPRWLARVRA